MTSQSETLLLPLLATLEMLGFVARHLEPSELGTVIEAVGKPDATLRAACAKLDHEPDDLDIVERSLRLASDEALAAFDGLRSAAAQGDMRAVFRTLRHVPRAQEALYPLASVIPAVNSFFLDPSLRDDADRVARRAQSARPGETGVIHANNDFGTRGGFSVYVPETYTPDRAWPLVMALHGGSGHGRVFLWNWLRDARSFDAIVVAPTAIGNTWALMGDDVDTPNLAHILDQARDRWSIDPARLLLTGMSDGGTFCYVSGLEAESPFTHLGPVSAAFHPMLVSMADAERMRGLPIYLAHGALDWMFPVEVARHAQRTLAAAGVDITYREIDDLSHCYPREINAPMLDWLKS